jgi:hypothetical protein
MKTLVSALWLSDRLDYSGATAGRESDRGREGKAQINNIWLVISLCLCILFASSGHVLARPAGEVVVDPLQSGTIWTQGIVRFPPTAEGTTLVVPVLALDRTLGSYLQSAFPDQIHPFFLPLLCAYYLPPASLDVTAPIRLDVSIHSGVFNSQTGLATSYLYGIDYDYSQCPPNM